MDTGQLLPLVGPVLAFVGIFAASGLTWLATRSNALLQIKEQRRKDDLAWTRQFRLERAGPVSEPLAQVERYVGYDEVRAAIEPIPPEKVQHHPGQTAEDEKRRLLQDLNEGVPNPTPWLRDMLPRANSLPGAELQARVRYALMV